MSKALVNKLIYEKLRIKEKDRKGLYKPARAEIDKIGGQDVSLSTDFIEDIFNDAEIPFDDSLLALAFNHVYKALKNSPLKDSIFMESNMVTVRFQQGYRNDFRNIVIHSLQDFLLSVTTRAKIAKLNLSMRGHFGHSDTTTVGTQLLGSLQSAKKGFMRGKSSLVLGKKTTIKYDQKLAKEAFNDALMAELEALTLDVGWDSSEIIQTKKYLKTVMIKGTLELQGVSNFAGSQKWDIVSIKNRLAKRLEETYFKELKKDSTKFATTGASPSSMDKLSQAVLASFIGELPNTKNIKKPKVKRPKGKKDSGSTPKIQVGSKKAKGKKKSQATGHSERIKKKKTDDSLINLQSLIPVFNQKLPQTVAANMGSPALNYQTGRFSESVQVTEIATTAKGHPSIGYTYRKNPYQVFEHPTGSPNLATPDRDPRKIINQSIREIAIGIMDQRFYTRRV